MRPNSKSEMNNAPPPSSSIRPPSSSTVKAPTLVSSMITGFGHSVGMNTGIAMMNNFFPINKEEKCKDMKYEFDKCFENIDCEDCYEITKKYKNCIIQMNKKLD
jgi:hypothetical protein